MDTYMTITCYGDRCVEAADAAETEIKRLDDLLSTGNDSSEISLINANGSGNVSSDTEILTEKAFEINKETEGAFDITVYPLMRMWGFTDHNYTVPDEESILQALKNVGMDKMTYDNKTITISAGQGIDLGGIAKGYTSDRIAEIFEEYGIMSGLISLGGNVHLYGTKTDGSLWKCGIRDPFKADDPQAVMGVLKTSDCAVITSGAYERYFTDNDGNVYHHIIDPSTGYPADSGLISSTIVSRSGILADGLSTAVYVMGLEKAEQFWKDNSDEFDMILMTEDGKVFITEGIEDRFSTEYSLSVITK